ncbi:MAG: M20/M25/M40 family metallo-hydrolase [Candidatus Eisenbacteria bacterium]|nr:M20/M25/M40 family metallo-hydrolase [Candidatus Eisenbacteria bacterium]
MFKELTEAKGISGFEDEVADLMASYVSDVATVTHDNLGSLVAEKKGKSESPRVMIAGHMDEIGFMVKNVTKEGFIKFLPIGGWWGHVALAQRVLVRTRKGDYVGVIGSKAPHILKPDERKKVLEISDMYIDVGAAGKFDVKKSLGVRPGDPIVPISDFTMLGNKKTYAAKAWDDRIGVATVIDVLHKIGKTHPNTVYGVGTVQEEVGLRGARTSSNLVDPDVAFAVDVTIATDTPGCDGAGEDLGAGAGIMVLDGSAIPSRRLRDFVIDVAEKEKIPYVLTALSRGGTDSGTIQFNKSGVPCLTFVVPSRYIHAHVGIIHRKDYDSLVKLMTAVVKRLDAKTVRSFVRG